MDELKNRHDVWKWLEGQGWKVSRATFYKHIKDGKIRPDERGEYSEKAAEKYAIQWLQKRTDAEHVKAEQLVEQERKEKIRYQAALRKKMELQLAVLQGKYVLKDLMYQELAGRLAVLETGIKNLFFVRMADYLAAGHVDKAVEMVAEDVDGLFSEYANTENFVLLQGREEAQR